MEKYITDERTGLQYELVGDYYLLAVEDETEDDRPIGIWGQRHFQYIRQHKRIFYSNLLTSGKLNDYLADLNNEAEEMLSRLVKQMADNDGITEELKVQNQLLWVQRMNNIRNAAREIVNADLIYS